MFRRRTSERLRSVELPGGVAMNGISGVGRFPGFLEKSMDPAIVDRRRCWPVDLVGLAVALGISALVAPAGSAFTIPSIDSWYASLAKPTWTPPNAVFPIVWPILFGMMAVAAWLVWRKKNPPRVGLALGLYMLHGF